MTVPAADVGDEPLICGMGHGRAMCDRAAVGALAVQALPCTDGVSSRQPVLLLLCVRHLAGFKDLDEDQRAQAVFDRPIPHTHV